MDIQDSLPQRLNQEVKLFWGCSYTELSRAFMLSLLILAALVVIFYVLLALLGLYNLGFSLVIAMTLTPFIFYKLAKAIANFSKGKHKGYITEYFYKHLPNQKHYFDSEGSFSLKRYL